MTAHRRAGLVVLLIAGLWLAIAGVSGAAAQTPSATVRLVVVTGSDGTNNPLLVELFRPSNLEDPFWLVVIAEGTGDLQPGQTNAYEFTVPAGFCDIVQFHLHKPASPGIGDDPWDIREYYVYVDGVEVAFDRVVYEYFSPQTVTSWPVNGNWQGTQAYQTRCGAALAPLDLSVLQFVPIGPGVFSAVGEPGATPAAPSAAPPSGLIAPLQPQINLSDQATPTPVAPVVVPPAGLIAPIQPQINLSGQATPTPVPPAQVVTCPGFMPSRLRVGGLGRVTPGAPNNLRSQPGTNSPLIGQIPGGAVFSVLGGPQCDGAGIAWWQVNYNGLVGWTGEGQGNVYWVEPVQ